MQLGISIWFSNRTFVRCTLYPKLKFSASWTIGLCIFTLTRERTLYVDKKRLSLSLNFGVLCKNSRAFAFRSLSETRLTRDLFARKENDFYVIFRIIPLHLRFLLKGVSHRDITKITFYVDSRWKITALFALWLRPITTMTIFFDIPTSSKFSSRLMGLSGDLARVPQNSLNSIFVSSKRDSNDEMPRYLSLSSSRASRRAKWKAGRSATLDYFPSIILKFPFIRAFSSRGAFRGRRCLRACAEYRSLGAEESRSLLLRTASLQLLFFFLWRRRDVTSVGRDTEKREVENISEK